MVDSRRRIGGISLASVRVSRRHRLRLVPPPLQPAPRYIGTERKRMIEKFHKHLRDKGTPFAHSEVRGTRTAETDMCR